MLLSNCHIKFIFPLALAVEGSALVLIFLVFIMFVVSCFIIFETNNLILKNIRNLQQNTVSMRKGGKPYLHLKCTSTPLMYRFFIGFYREITLLNVKYNISVQRHIFSPSTIWQSNHGVP